MSVPGVFTPLAAPAPGAYPPLATREVPFIQRLRSHIAAVVAQVITILTLGRLEVDPTGRHTKDHGRGGVDCAACAPVEEEEQGDQR